ncbi:hypothetical protein KY285_005564 [Solanum tuberosum]|nr:hypothetical protein KY285_005564 [Solanum tuberosum]
MSSREMSMEDENSFVSNTNAIIYASSDISGWTHSLISDNNIPNSSYSANVDDRQQQISTANDDSMIVSSGASSSWFNNNNKQIHDHQEIRIFNVDFRALCNNRLKSRGGSEFSSGLLLDTGRTVKEETRVKLVNTLMACAEAIQENNLSLADVLISDIKRKRRKMSSGEMSMDTIMEDEDSFVSNTNAIIYASSDISGWTHSLISDNNITNSSSSTGVDDRQQQISTGGGGDSMIVSSSASSSWFNNYKQIDDQQGVRIFNVDFRALCNKTCCGSESRGGLPPDTSRIVNEETSVRLVNLMLVFAEAIEENNLTLADVLNSQIRRLTIAMKKMATYFAEAFYLKIHRLIPQDIAESSYSNDQLLHMSFYESFPLPKLAHFTANQSILEAFADSKRVHVIDFSLNQGLQWLALLQALALHPGGPPAFRLSGISGQPKSDDGSDPLQEVGFKIAQFAESIGVEFELCGFLAYTLADLEASMLNIRPSNEEAVGVNSVFELQPLFSIPGAIEKVMDLIKQIEPKIVTITEREMNHKGSVFSSRIIEAWHYYSTMFDFLEKSELINPNTLDMVMAKQCLDLMVLEIHNLVACEGTKRIVRHETLGQWQVRINSAGFNLVPLTSNTYKQAAMLLALFPNAEGYKVEVKDESLVLSWHSLPLIATSAWRLCSQV